VSPLSARLSLHRDWWRFRAPLSAGEIRRTERWLATARVALSIAAIVALWMEPKSGFAYSRWLYWLLTVYLVHGVVVMLLLRFRHESTPNFRLVVHSIDILWPALIAIFTTAQAGPFFLFFVFVMTAAAYRWGLWETVGTAAAMVVLLWAETLLVRAGLEKLADRWLAFFYLPPLGLSLRHLDLQQPFMTSAYLMVLGLLLGYMSENQKRLRAERAVITRVLGSTRVEAGLTGTLETILGEMLNMYAAERVLTASQEVNSYRVFLGEIGRASDGLGPLRWREATPETEAAYHLDSQADALYAKRNNGAHDALILDRSGRRLREIPPAFLDDFSRIVPFRSLAAVTFAFGREWSGRIFLINPETMGDREEELRFLQEFAQQVGPAVHNVYLMRRLRQRAGALERGRFARELHDGAIQSLIAVEMQLDVLRRQAAQQAPAVNTELSRIQQLLREEVLKLRELMQEMKSFEVDSDRLLAFLSDTVERFRRETGVSAEFISEIKEVELPQKVCRELARIVQESLVNVRKHSGAHNVLVRLARRGGAFQLSIEDDGKGFPFSGTLSESELDGKGPVVIRDRVRLLAGQLTIESNPGHGARLEVRIPPARQTSHG
jgi:signal transduction histidine kinase